jgi:hypothetical protein
MGFGFSFLTPLDALFALAAAVPLAALWLTQANIRRIRELFSLTPTRRRELLGVVAALALLPMLLGVAAAQPVVVHSRMLGERSDTQAFFIFDTSLSMSARKSRGAPTRLARAIREAEGIIPKLGDIPVGVATMTDRVLPVLMPTPNMGLVLETFRQSLGIDRPPPSELYRGRATTLQALIPIANSNLFNPGVKHPILVVFTDGEAAPLRGNVGFDLARSMEVHPLFVHVWGPTERIYLHGRVDPRYLPDPSSGRVLSQFAAAARGRVFGENDLGGLAETIRAETGNAPAKSAVVGYARVALAPWFVLAGVVPLGFLLYRRNL